MATLYYPGGSQHDPNSIGYNWKNNYLSILQPPTFDRSKRFTRADDVSVQ